jgi:hypothetical protein
MESLLIKMELEKLAILKFTMKIYLSIVTEDTEMFSKKAFYDRRKINYRVV